MVKTLAKAFLGVFLTVAAFGTGFAKGGVQPAKTTPVAADKATPATPATPSRAAKQPAKPAAPATAEGKAVRKHFRKEPMTAKKHPVKKQKKQGAAPAKPLHPKAVPATPPTK